MLVSVYHCFGVGDWGIALAGVAVFSAIFSRCTSDSRGARVSQRPPESSSRSIRGSRGNRADLADRCLLFPLFVAGIAYRGRLRSVLFSVGWASTSASSRSPSSRLRRLPAPGQHSQPRRRQGAPHRRKVSLSPRAARLADRAVARQGSNAGAPRTRAGDAIRAF